MIQEVPINGRDLQQLVYLLPGVANASGPPGSNFGFSSQFGTFPDPTFTQGSDVSVNGGQAGANSWYLDGNLNLSGLAENIVVNPSPDAVSEFAAITNGFAAEYGHTGGGVFNVVLKLAHKCAARKSLRVRSQQRYQRPQPLHLHRCDGPTHPRPRPAFQQLRRDFRRTRGAPQNLQWQEQDLLLRFGRSAGLTLGWLTSVHGSDSFDAKGKFQRGPVYRQRRPLESVQHRGPQFQRLVHAHGVRHAGGRQSLWCQRLHKYRGRSRCGLGTANLQLLVADSQEYAGSGGDVFHQLLPAA